MQYTYKANLMYILIVILRAPLEYDHEHQVAKQGENKNHLHTTSWNTHPNITHWFYIPVVQILQWYWCTSWSACKLSTIHYKKVKLNTCLQVIENAQNYSKYHVTHTQNHRHLHLKRIWEHKLILWELPYLKYTNSIQQHKLFKTQTSWYTLIYLALQMLCSV